MCDGIHPIMLAAWFDLNNNKPSLYALVMANSMRPLQTHTSIKQTVNPDLMAENIYIFFQGKTAAAPVFGLSGSNIGVLTTASPIMGSPAAVLSAFHRSHEGPPAVSISS